MNGLYVALRRVGARGGRHVIYLTLILGLSGCTTIRATSDYDANVNFDRYKRFAWVSDKAHQDAAHRDAAQQGVVINPVEVRRTKLAIQRKLIEKGFDYVETNADADFVVAFTLGERERISAHTYPLPYYSAYYGYSRGRRGAGSRYYGFGYDPWFDYRRDLSIQTYIQGLLAIDMYDQKTNDPIWHGMATRRLEHKNAEVAEAHTVAIVSAILEKFPPALK